MELWLLIDRMHKLIPALARLALKQPGAGTWLGSGNDISCYFL